jgi:hypothetical protein
VGHHAKRTAALAHADTFEGRQLDPANARSELTVTKI